MNLGEFSSYGPQEVFPLINVKSEISKKTCSLIRQDEKCIKEFRKKTGLDISKTNLNGCNFFQLVAAYNYCNQILEKNLTKLEVDSHQFEAAKKLNIIGEQLGKDIRVNKLETGKLQLIFKTEDEELQRRIQALVREDIPLEGANSDQEKITSVIQDVQDSIPQVYCAHIPDQQIITFFVEDRSIIDKAKQKIKVGLGQIKIRSRANRIFTSSSKTMNSEQKAEVMAGIKNQTIAGADPSGVQPFIRGKLLDVMVYKGNITHLSVNAIVNAANGRLAHGAGVARAIADAAGDDLLKEGNRYIQEHGVISVTGVAVTTAGRLPCKKVIHAVGPAMYDYKDETKCLEDLCKTILRCLCEARNLNMSSVAIPSISSGIYGVPKPSCAEMYVRAVKSFDTVVTGGSLKQVHFVDVNDEMLGLIQNEFVNEWNKKLDDRILRLDSKFIKQCLDDLPGRSSPAGQGTSLVHSSNSAGTSGYAAAAAGRKPSSSKSAADDGIQVIVYKDDIFKVHSQAIVCWKNPDFRGKDQVIAQMIFNKSGEKYKKHLNEIKKKYHHSVPSGLVFAAHCENIKQSLVIHGIIHRIGSSMTDLQQMIPKIIAEVHQKSLSSVVIPVFKGLSDGVKVFTETLCTAVKDFSRKNPHSTLKQIHVVDHDQKTVDVVSGIVQNSGINNETLSKRTHTLQDSLSQSSSSLYHSADGAADDDNCVICMDTMTNPVRLNKCGHTFCKDCIDSQFQINKPVCPNCGEVYGMLTGNMPTGGTMFVSRSYIDLPGYEHYGHYCISYSFPGGKQTKDHSDEGKWYSGIKRTAYLPDTPEGRTVLAMLRVAWERRLTFTIGRSVTTGQEGVITWNDIHHKTNIYDGQNKFGYPDPGYLARVKAELADKGITEESIQDPKYKKLTGTF